MLGNSAYNSLPITHYYFAYHTEDIALAQSLLAQKRIFRDADIDISPLASKTVAILGYGNQGRPQGLNLRDSGIHVLVAARAGSDKFAQAEADGLEAMAILDAVQQADVLMMLFPDEVMHDVFEAEVQPYLRPGQYLGFGHGLAVHAGWIDLPPELNVFLVAPKGQGRGVRNKYLAESGVPGLIAVAQDVTGDTEAVAKAYAKAIGCGRAGVMPTTFEEEAVCDLFSEQVVLCGGLTSLIQNAFETLVEAGYAPETAYFECLYEVKLIADLLHEKGIAGMRDGISSTALFGDISRGHRVIDAHVKDTMRTVLGEIQSGLFAQQMLLECGAGKPVIKTQIEADRGHLIEQTHRHLVREGVLSQ